MTPSTVSDMGNGGGNGPPRSLGSVISKLAQVVDRGLSPGDVAALRRLDPHDPAAPAFWKLAVAYLEPAGVLGLNGTPADHLERRWAVVLAALAHLSGLHQRGQPLGRSLADAGYTELRFTRLLRARGDPLLRLTTEAVRYLAAKAQPVNIADVARLVLSDRRRDAEATRRRIARDYFAALS